MTTKQDLDDVTLLFQAALLLYGVHTFGPYGHPQAEELAGQAFEKAEKLGWNHDDDDAFHESIVKADPEEIARAACNRWGELRGIDFFEVGE